MDGKIHLKPESPKANSSSDFVKKRASSFSSKSEETSLPPQLDNNMIISKKDDVQYEQKHIRAKHKKPKKKEITVSLAEFHQSLASTEKDLSITEKVNNLKKDLEKSKQ